MAEQNFIGGAWVDPTTGATDAVIDPATGQDQSPFVPALPRFTGGAVGYRGYEAASWFEPTAARADGAAMPGDDAAHTRACPTAWSSSNRSNGIP